MTNFGIKQSPSISEKITKKTSSSWTINGTVLLHEVRKTDIFKGTTILEHIVEEEDYPLREVSVEELFELRASGQPGFVLKENGSYFYTQVPMSIKIIGNGHCCSGINNSSAVCRRLSAASDCNGGCAKVRDLDPSEYEKHKLGAKESLARSKRIEKYDFILRGFEAFNTSYEFFVVLECNHYAPCKQSPKLSSTEVNALKVGLAQFVWDDVFSRSDIIKKMEAQKAQY